MLEQINWNTILEYSTITISIIVFLFILFWIGKKYFGPKENQSSTDINDKYMDLIKKEEMLDYKIAQFTDMHRSLVFTIQILAVVFLVMTLVLYR